MKVFEWLGCDSKGVPYYLHALNLMWSDEGVEHDLQVYRRVASMLAAEPTYWAEIIREASWRHSLAGCTCLLAAPCHEFYDDLCYRFRAGSFVAPQIAVTLGLVHRDRASGFFESVLDDPALRGNAKVTVSAQRVLQLLRVLPGHELPTDMWGMAERDNAIVAESVARAHWEFWSDRV